MIVCRRGAQTLPGGYRPDVAIGPGHDAGSIDIARCLPAAADERLRPLLTGPVQPASALAVLPDAIHLMAGTALIVVCGPSAVRLPGSVVVAHSLTDVLDLDHLDPVTVGSDGVRIGAVELQVCRWTAAPRPRLRDVEAATRRALEIGGRIPPLPLPLDALASQLRQALDGAARPGGDAEIRAVVDRLVGLGPGLTPAGDDVLAGALVALHAASDPRHRALARHVFAQRERTAAVSAALLDAAAAGRCIPQVARLIVALDGRGDVDPALAALLAVGHTSGAAIATGIVAALTAVLSRRGRRVKRVVDVRRGAYRDSVTLMQVSRPSAPRRVLTRL